MGANLFSEIKVDHFGPCTKSLCPGCMDRRNMTHPFAPFPLADEGVGSLAGTIRNPMPMPENCTLRKETTVYLCILAICLVYPKLPQAISKCNKEQQRTTRTIAPGGIMTKATPCGRSPFRPASERITGITAAFNSPHAHGSHGSHGSSAEISSDKLTGRNDKMVPFD